MNEHISLPLTLKPSFRRALMILPGALIIALFAAMFILFGITYASIAMNIVGGVFIAVLLILLKAFRADLTLYDSGFVFNGVIKKLEVKWADTNWIMPLSILGISSNIGWRYTNEYKKNNMRKFSRALSVESQPDISILGFYLGYSNPELASLMNRLRYAATPAPPLSYEHKFALAVSAILTEMNGQRHDCLHGDLPGFSITTQAKEVLSSAWGVSNSIELIECLTWLKKDGDRKEYENLVTALSEIGEYSDPLQLLKPEVVAGMTREQKYEFKRETSCVLQHSSQHASILAWDLCRLVSVARFGAASRYITDDEAWEWILDAASTVRNALTSWRELADNYLVGRDYSGIAHGTAEVNTSVRKLLDKNNSLSPWNYIPWDTTPKVYGSESGTMYALPIESTGTIPHNIVRY